MPVDFSFFKDNAIKKPSLPTKKSNLTRLQQIDLNEPILYYDEKGKRPPRRRHLTQKQKKTAQYMLQGYNQFAALKKAGYSVKTAVSMSTPKDKSLQTILSYVETMAQKMRGKGLSEDYFADKIKEWMEAKKVVSARPRGRAGLPGVGELSEANEQTDDFIEVPDYDIQLKAYDRAEKIFSPQSSTKMGKKREVTFTEWVQEDIQEEV